nr:MAG TPA: hypothetical protein [Caudoviricetes sp.]DAR92789.1 MAG TPA: hypothetical protein [Caudoviricetes sp.]
MAFFPYFLQNPQIIDFYRTFCLLVNFLVVRKTKNTFTK